MSYNPWHKSKWFKGFRHVVVQISVMCQQFSFFLQFSFRRSIKIKSTCIVIDTKHTMMNTVHVLCSSVKPTSCPKIRNWCQQLSNVCVSSWYLCAVHRLQIHITRADFKYFSCIQVNFGFSKQKSKDSIENLKREKKSLKKKIRHGWNKSVLNQSWYLGWTNLISEHIQKLVHNGFQSTSLSNAFHCDTDAVIVCMMAVFWQFYIEKKKKKKKKTQNLCPLHEICRICTQIHRICDATQTRIHRGNVYTY